MKRNGDEVFYAPEAERPRLDSTDGDDEQDILDDFDSDILEHMRNSGVITREYVVQNLQIEDQTKFSSLLAGTAPRLPLSKYRLLGKSGLRVSKLCLGTILNGTSWTAAMGEITKETAWEVMDAYVEAGGNFFDTALAYQDGDSTAWLGEWLDERKNRDKLVIAAKWSLPIPPYNINTAGNSRKSLLYAVDATLKALHTDYIDLLYVNVWDHTTPIEEMMRALDDLVRRDKVRYLGVSDTPAWVVAKANTLAQEKGWTPFVCFQGKFTPAEREAEHEIIPMCRSCGLSFIPWGIQPWCVRYPPGLASSHPPVAPSPLPTGSAVISAAASKTRDFSKEEEHLDKVITSIAQAHKCNQLQVVLSWALQKDTFVSILLSCSSVEMLQECIKSLKVTLTPKEVKDMDTAVPYRPGYPMKYLGLNYNTSPWFGKAGVIQEKW